MKLTHRRPDVFDYLDYPQFLRDMYAYFKATETGFSHRVFAHRAGFNASSNLMQAMKGEANLTLPSIRKFAKGLGLDRRETKYFEELVVWTQATDPEYRRAYEDKIRRKHNRFKGSRVQQDSYAYFSNWYAVVLLELLGMQGIPDDPKELKKLLIPRVGWQKVAAALQVLERLGLIEQQADGWATHQTVLETEDEIADAASRNYHRDMIGMAQASVDQFGPDKRLVGGITSGIRAEDFDELKAFLNQQRREMLTFLTKLNGRPGINRVVQVNYQAFPVSEDVER